MSHTYKGNKYEEIKEQYYNGVNGILYVVTRTNDNKWHLYNHTKDKLILTSDDWQNIRDKMKMGDHT